MADKKNGKKATGKKAQAKKAQAKSPRARAVTAPAAVSEPKLLLANVIETEPGRFLTTINGADLEALWSNGVIRYRPDIQRGEKTVTNKKGEVKMKPVYSPSNVRKIYEKMIAGTYHTDTIVINILKDGGEQFSFEDGTLTVYGGEVNILDGQHRLRALHMAKAQEKKGLVDLKNMIFPLQIEHWAEGEAQDAFYQYSQGLKVNTTRAEFFNNTRYENLIAKNLLKDSDLRDKVEIVKGTVDRHNPHRLVTFATLVSAVHMAFPKVATDEEAEEVSAYLKEFFAELLKLVPELRDPEKRLASREHSLVAENFAFYGYLGLASLLKGQKSWKKALKKVVEMDLSKASAPWLGNVIRQGRQGYIVVNSRDSKQFFLKTFQEEFQKLSAS